MNMVKDAVALAKHECEANGVRLTPKRLNVLSILLRQDRAISAYELAEQYEQAFEEPVPIITVYRVLDFLQCNNLVHKLETANKYIVCSHTDCDHSHRPSQFLICKVCLKVEELSMSPLKFDELNKTVEQAGFHFIKPQIEMNCICDACYDKAK